MFPSLFLMLCTHPGVGKYVIELVRELWTETKNPDTHRQAFHVAPDSMTKASMVDGLAEAKQSRADGTDEVKTYHSLLIAAEEMGVFMPAYDLAFVALLNKLWNNPGFHQETRRHGPSKDVSIENPTVNLICGVQPGWLASVFPEEAWSTGLTSRMVMVYASEAPFIHLFAEDQAPKEEIREGILKQLGRLSVASGACKWAPAAAHKLGEWDAGGGLPTPKHSKLEHYVRRRTAMVIKLSMIAALSRTGQKTIEEEDVSRGLSWLLEAEQTMPDIFRAMVGKSDIQVIQELHHAVVSHWTLSKGKPIGEEFVFRFLAERVPSDKVARVLEAAERAGFIIRFAGTNTFRPAGKFNEVE